MILCHHCKDYFCAKVAQIVAHLFAAGGAYPIVKCPKCGATSTVTRDLTALREVGEA